MHFFNELRKEGIHYAISDTFAKVREHSNSPSTAFSVKVCFPEGDPVEKSFTASRSENQDILNLLVAVLRKESRCAALMKRWFESRGHAPVRLVEGILENIPTAVHTALRKCTDSRHSSILWNGIHVMHRADARAFWEVIASAIKKVFADCSEGVTPTRWVVGMALKAAVIEFLDCRHMDDLVVSGKTLERTQEQRFVLISISAACALTEDDDWMWGWLGFVLEDTTPLAAVPG
jgi:hypothetical protein